MNLELKNDDFKKEVLTAENGYERVTEQIKGDLGDLHENILKDFNDDVDKKSDVIVDINPAKKFLDGLKDKKFSEIQAEGASWAFAVQLLLKQIKGKDGLPYYKGKVDGLYGGTNGKTNAAVKAFQKSVGFTGKDIDGWAGGKTIKKLLEKVDSTLNGKSINSDRATNNTESDEKRIFNEADLVSNLKLSKRGSFGYINVYKRDGHSGVYIFDDGALKYYEGNGQQQEYAGLDKDKKEIWIKNNKVDGDLMKVYTQVKQIDEIKNMKIEKIKPSFDKIAASFSKNYKITNEDYKLLSRGLKEGIFDNSGSTFHEYHGGTASQSQNDYMTIKDGELKKIGDIGQGNTVFEVDGTGYIDDYRFDSIEAFFERLKQELD